MLAKQVCRLANDPDSLCARVLRAKYYSRGDILKARPKVGASFTCQSIIAGLSTIKKGFIRRVGNGKKINIWTDPWIPSRADRRVLSPRGAAVYTRVSELISPITWQWDGALIRSLFQPLDVTRILQIPLHHQGFNEFIA
jgi:hypothetical protein